MFQYTSSSITATYNSLKKIKNYITFDKEHPVKIKADSYQQPESDPMEDPQHLPASERQDQQS